MGLFSRCIMIIYTGLLLLVNFSNVGAKFAFHIATIERGYNESSSFSYPKVGAAVDMALEYVRKKYNDTLDIKHTVRLAKGGPTEAPAVAADLYHKENVDAFIGPGSSSAVEVVGYLVTQWNLPFVTPVGSAGNLGDKTLYPTLTRMSPIPVEHYASFTLKLLDVYSWKHFVVLHDKARVSDLHWDSLYTLMKDATGYSWMNYQMDKNTFTERDYEFVMTEANKHARIFIIQAEKEAVRTLMLIAHRLGFTKGEHVMIISIKLERELDESYWRFGDEFDEIAKEAFQSGLFLVRASTVSSEYVGFVNEVKERSLRDYNFDYGNTSVHMSVESYYDCFTMFAQVLNETVARGEDPRDGRAFARKLWNRTYPGIANDVMVTADGRRDASLNLLDVDPVTGAFKIVGSYASNTKIFSPEVGTSIHWPYTDRPPPDVPKCGFRDDQCTDTQANSKLTIGLSATFAVILVLACVIGGICIRRWKSKSEEDLWWWKIDSQDISLTDNSKLGSVAMSFTSKISIMTGKSDVIYADYYSQAGMYKGHVVRLRKLQLRQFTVARALLLEFKQLREMTQANLVRVIGACLENSPQYLVTEYCSKGTLQDLLGNTRVALDTNFKFSLCIDVAQGMNYIHSSPVLVHGRLSSARCLIDNRFSVKLADIGLPTLYNSITQDETSQEFKIECLWKAPEILRDMSSPPTQAGDIYAFGIILQEILTREGPFAEETNTFTVNEILEKIKRGAIPPFRPKIDVSEKLNDLKSLMESCWCEDPDRRPPFSMLRKSLRILASRFGGSGNLLDNLLRRMEQYANNLEKLVDEKTVELKEEKKKSEELLYQILPRSVAQQLRLGKRVDPEHYSCVTIYFSDICGFTTLSANSTPIQVVALLNDLYTCFDAVCDSFDVYKVETIGDAYMVVSGLPQRNGNRHVSEIAKMSLALLKATQTFTIAHMPEENLRLRIGLHSGPVVAGVVGLKMPRYCLFGDTVNTASRMESHGAELKIHMSCDTAELLSAFQYFQIEHRGLINIKGKGDMDTYWLCGEKEGIK